MNAWRIGYHLMVNKAIDGATTSQDPGVRDFLMWVALILIIAPFVLAIGWALIKWAAYLIVTNCEKSNKQQPGQYKGPRY